MLMASASDATIVAALVSGVGGALTTVLGFWLRTRMTSGSVGTSSASQLWGEVDKHLKRLDAQIAAQSHEIADLKLELIQRDEKILKLEGERDRLTTRVESLEFELARVNERATAAAQALTREAAS